MLSISDLFPLTRYKPSVFRPEEKQERSREKGEDSGGHSGKQAKHKHFISPAANSHDNTDAEGVLNALLSHHTWLRTGALRSSNKHVYVTININVHLKKDICR